jgi:hypothetical protein
VTITGKLDERVGAIETGAFMIYGECKSSLQIHVQLEGIQRGNSEFLIIFELERSL